MCVVDSINRQFRHVRNVFSISNSAVVVKYNIESIDNSTNLTKIVVRPFLKS